MATTWLPRTNFDPRSWLLGNGEIVTEPPLEQTPSGRKVRIAGTNISAFSRDMEDLIKKSVALLADKKGTSVWMSLTGAENALQNELGFKPEETKAELYTLKKPLGEATIVWWRFRHPTLPIEAVVSIRAARTSPQAYANHAVTTRLAMPVTSPSTTLTANAETVADSAFTGLVGYSWEQTKAREFIRDNPVAWASVLGSETFGTERLVIEGLLAKVREVDDLESILIPNLLKEDEPEWLELELYDTNVNATFISDLQEYLEGTPTVTEALRIYKELQECLRGIGMVLEDKTENHFQTGLLGGDSDAVTIALNHPHEEDGALDREHTLRMHLPTGTFVVDCSARISVGEVAEKWDELRTIASLTGEEDTLIAFAREQARRGQEERARRIIKGRKGK